MIRAVTFDLDDTLFDFQACMAAAAAQVIRVICERYPSAEGRATPERFHAFWQDATAEAREKGGILDWPAIRQRGIEILLADSGCEAEHTLATELTALYFHHRHAPVAPFEDAVATLPCLADRLPLGIITNANTQLAQLGLATQFSVVVTPTTAGCMKPEPAIFHHAATLLGCAPAELLHVGDSWADDVVGALGAGCQAAWYCRVPKPLPVGDMPHCMLGDHRELIPWLLAKSCDSRRPNTSPKPG